MNQIINKIYNENCLATTKRMPDDFVDLTVTSPPYDDLRKYNEYSFDFESVAKELLRITKPNGVITWVVSDSSIGGGETLTSFKQALFFRDIGFTINDTMIYTKPNRRPRQYSAHRYEQIFEYIFVLVKGTKSKTFNPIEEKCLNAGKTINFSSRDHDGDKINTKKTVKVKRQKEKVIYGTTLTIVLE